MSLRRAIEHGKERRRPYRDSRAIDGTCENHGSCPWCHGNRLYTHRRQDEAARHEQIEWDSPSDEELGEALRRLRERPVSAANIAESWKQDALSGDGCKTEILPERPRPPF